MPAISQIRASGDGKITIIYEDGSGVTISEVKYVENSVSGGQFEIKGQYVDETSVNIFDFLGQEEASKVVAEDIFRRFQNKTTTAIKGYVSSDDNIDKAIKNFVSGTKSNNFYQNVREKVRKALKKKFNSFVFGS